MVPGQQIAGKVEKQHQQQERDADQPVERAPLFESAGEKDADQVEAGGDDQQVGRPVMDGANERAKGDPALQQLDADIGSLDGGLVAEHEHHAGGGEHEGEQGRDAAQTPGGAKAQRRGRHAGRVDVEDQVVGRLFHPAAPLRPRLGPVASFGLDRW